MCAHSGQESVMRRYSFSHTNSIASFQFLRLSSSIPPSSFLEWRVSSAKRWRLLFPHMNSLINFVRAFLMWSGMPCTFVRNCVRPPIIIWVSRHFPFSIGTLFGLWSDPF